MARPCHKLSPGKQERSNSDGDGSSQDHCRGAWCDARLSWRWGIVHALRGIDLRIEPGEFVALRGRSGSGKTTLLNILIGLDNPTQGKVYILGRDLSELDESARARMRRESIGMMF
jgi:predicted ABC-type transport system involved in lysophospholipase L1 biosynthesis ATPase subunit